MISSNSNQGATQDGALQWTNRVYGDDRGNREPGATNVSIWSHDEHGIGGARCTVELDLHLFVDIVPRDNVELALV